MRLRRLGVVGGTRVDFLDLREVPGVSVPEPGAPRFTLAPPAPNPARAEVEIRFSLAAPGPAMLTVYDIAGRRVATLVDGPLPAGPQRARWDGQDTHGGRAPAGRYFVRLAAGGQAQVRSVVVLR